MAVISAALVRELRDKTGAGMMDCKKALSETAGELDKAVDFLRTKGLSAAAKKAGRATDEGLVFSYIHPGGRVGVLLEINCESDFVARTDEFQNLCKDIAMHVAAVATTTVRRKDFDSSLLEHETEIFKAQAVESGKPAEIAKKMVAGRIEKLYKEQVLMEQSFVKDPSMTVEELLKTAISKLGENMSVRRFMRYELGS